MAGYLLAVVSSIFFSLYIIPRKLTKQPPLMFSLLVGLGFFVSSVVLYLFKPILGISETPSWSLLWCLLAGIGWAVGIVCLVKSIDCIGLSRSNQWKNLQGPMGVILSLAILAEYVSANPLYAVLAGFAVFLSAVLFTVPNHEVAHDPKNTRVGVVLAVASALAFGAVTVMNKHVTDTVGVYLQQIVWSFSIFISLLVYMMVRKQLVPSMSLVNRRDMALGLGSGLLYLGASFFMLQAYHFIPASIGFTIIQLNTIWTISIGILVFKEIDVRKYPWRILFGFVFSLVGIVLLVYAKK